MATKKPKVLIALTCQRLVFADCALSLIRLSGTKRDFDIAFHLEKGADIASSRNRVVQAARDIDATPLLFVDYDMSLPGDALAKLLEQDKDIIGADYNKLKEPIERIAVPVEAPAPTDAPFKAEALGTGFLLIKMSVFDKMEAPWFMWGYNPDGTLLYGEDTYFCQMAKNKAGFDVWADPTLNVKHIGEQLF